MNTLVVVLNQIEKTQNEIIPCMVTQICENVENCTVVDFYKDFKLQKTLYGEYDLYKADQWLYDNWLSIYKHYREMVEEFDNVILLKTPTLRGIYPRVLDEKFLKEIDKGIVKDNKYQMTQDTMKRVIERLVFVKACRDKNVFQFCMDTEEVDFSKVWKFKSYKRLYTFKNKGFEYFPMFEWALANTYIQPVDKVMEYYYIGSAFTKEREQEHIDRKKMLDKYTNKRVRGYSNVGHTAVRGKYEWYNSEERREARMAQDKYYYYLKLSKYTLVNKPYDTERFNMVRFMEALILDCIPIILPGNNLDDLELTYPDLYDIILIKNVILTRRDTNAYRPMDFYINTRLARYEEDLDTIERLKNTKSYQMITNQELVQKKFKKLLGGS